MEPSDIIAIIDIDFDESFVVLKYALVIYHDLYTLFLCILWFDKKLHIIFRNVLSRPLHIFTYSKHPPCSSRSSWMLGNRHLESSVFADRLWFQNLYDFESRKPK